MRRYLEAVCVDEELIAQLTFDNPASDTGITRVEATPLRTSITLRPVPPRPGASAEYPVGEGYRVTFPVHNIPLVNAWGLVQFHTVEPEDPNSAPSTVTDVRARLHDGTDEYVWDGAAWAVAVDLDADWNTLEEVKENLPSFPLGPLGFVFELSTTHRLLAPQVLGYRFVYSVDLPNELNDWVYGALIGTMQDAIRPEHDLLVESDGTTTLDIGAIEAADENTWRFEEVIGVYDEDDDPAHATNLLASFNTVTRIATLSPAPPDGNTLRVRLTFIPLIAVTTDPDYTEMPSCPAILFETIRVIDLADAPMPDGIVDVFVTPAAAILFPPPRHTHIEFSVTLWAALSVDRSRLWECLMAWLINTPSVESPVSGRRATLRPVEPGLEFGGPVESSGLRTARMAFRLENVYFHHRQPVEAGSGLPGSQYAFGVTSVVMTTFAGAATVNTEVGD